MCRISRGSEGVFLWNYRIDNYFYVFGPVSSDYTPYSQIHEFYSRYKIDRFQLYLPHMEIQQIIDLICFTYYAVTDREVMIEDILEQQKEDIFNREKEKVRYHLQQMSEGKAHNTYEEELAWIDAIKNGTPQKETRFSGKAGMMSKNSDRKQYEYTVVSEITILTRAAIDAGVLPKSAYETSDLLLQRVSTMNTVDQYMNMFGTVEECFRDLIQDKREDKNKGSLASQCKDYIAGHLYQEFSVQKMAEDLSFNRTYMSRTFSQRTGKTLQAYIREERLHAAANLLKYSPASVAQISDYMHFSSPGRFSEYFKNYYGISPFRYRDENQLIEFKEK